MSLLTSFFNLIKPAKTDGVKVSDFNANMDIIDTEMHKPPLTVNGVTPNPLTRDLKLDTVPFADNLATDEAQLLADSFIERTAGGSSSIFDGSASLSVIKGSMERTGYTAESLSMQVNAVPRVAPPAITATLDEETFEAYVETAGTYVLEYDDGEWDKTPSDYGLTIENDPVNGDKITIVWDGETDATVTVTAVPRDVPAAITATLDRDTFVAYVPSSGTVTLSYTTAWSANPALYGVTVTNTPVSGDSIVIEYTKEVRGTITPVQLTSFNATGWNLYDNSVGYARVVKYSNIYGYMVQGNYSLLAFSTTPTGTPVAITVDEDGLFDIPSDGFVIVTGGDATTTAIFPTWSDWDEGYVGSFEPYNVHTIDFTAAMAAHFPYGLLAIGEVCDEMNFNIQKSYDRISRVAYTDANLAAAKAAGRPYTYDENYIYQVRATAIESDISIDGIYTASDHGIEFFIGSSIPVYTEILYGQNLKDKLRRDVVTISGQVLSDQQKAQVRENIGAVGEDSLAAVEGEIGIVVRGNKTAYTSGATSGQYVIVRGSTISGIPDGTYKATKSIPYNTAIDSTYLTPVSGGAANSLLEQIGTLNSKIANYGKETQLLSADSTGEKTLSDNRGNYRYIMAVIMDNITISSQIFPRAAMIGSGYNVYLEIGNKNCSFKFDVNDGTKVTINSITANTTIRIYGIE